MDTYRVREKSKRKTSPASLDVKLHHPRDTRSTLHLFYIIGFLNSKRLHARIQRNRVKEAPIYIRVYTNEKKNEAAATLEVLHIVYKILGVTAAAAALLTDAAELIALDHC